MNNEEAQRKNELWVVSSQYGFHDTLAAIADSVWTSRTRVDVDLLPIVQWQCFAFSCAVALTQSIE